ncbi:unnamed protein product [Trichogramma brassicae]|uniref:Uncharacterized protein n=1 Tax=Trichogramma brassicae TaxID=86971 RepID=A0A6H5HST8_9HYME|nr:unnamed protein product [Trichogramma brassicae]
MSRAAADVDRVSVQPGKQIRMGVPTRFVFRFDLAASLDKEPNSHQHRRRRSRACSACSAQISSVRSSRASRIYYCVQYNSFFDRDHKRKGSTFFACNIKFAIRKCVLCIVARGRKCFQEIRGDPRTSSLRRT